jgi:hypothetical protein
MCAVAQRGGNLVLTPSCLCPCPVRSIGDSFFTGRDLVAQAILHKVSSVVIAGFWVLLHPNKPWLEFMEGKLVGNTSSVKFVRIILGVFSKLCMLFFMKATVDTVYADNEVGSPLMWLRESDLQTEKRLIVRS